jgi:hypothetical protein
MNEHKEEGTKRNGGNGYGNEGRRNETNGRNEKRNEGTNGGMKRRKGRREMK